MKRDGSPEITFEAFPIGYRRRGKKGQDKMFCCLLLTWWWAGYEPYVKVIVYIEKMYLTKYYKQKHLSIYFPNV